MDCLYKKLDIIAWAQSIVRAVLISVFGLQTVYQFETNNKFLPPSIFTRGISERIYVYL
jgi:hypothetical protein